MGLEAALPVLREQKQVLAIDDPVLIEVPPIHLLSPEVTDPFDQVQPRNPSIAIDIPVRRIRKVAEPNEFDAIPNPVRDQKGRMTVRIRCSQKTPGGFDSRGKNTALGGDSVFRPD